MQQVLPIAEVVSWAQVFLLDYQKASAVKESHAPIDRSAVRWLPPSTARLFKVNSDAAVDSSGFRIGFGIVIRVYRGFVVTASSQVLPAGVTPIAAEALALYHE
ncbi:hypothetical protein ACOSQ4_026666 [Xanthoceras sorbifolium]